MSNLSVLIVEDERVVAMDLRVLLERLGYSVPAIASSGTEALERALEHSPDLILMDIRLRGEPDGIGAAAQIRAHMDVPVIFLTAYADRTTRERVREIAPYGYLVKPFNEPTLQTTIEMALERHAQERKLREREQWFATTLASIGDAVIATDTDGWVTYVNPVAEQLLGRAQAHILGRDVAEVVLLINGESSAPMPSLVRTVLSTGTALPLPPEAALRGQTGTPIPIDGTVAPIKVEPGTLLGAVMVFRDSTIRLQAEQARRAQMLQQEQARQHERLRTLAGGIAHDLNNLLMTVMGNTEIARMDIADSPDSLGALEAIDSATQRAADLARQLLAYAGGRRPIRQPIDLNTLVRDLLHTLGTTRLRPYTLTTRLAPQLPLTVADATQIRQIVQNLLINAAEAMGPGGGTLTVTTERWQHPRGGPAPLTDLAPGEYLALTIGDTGSGMDQATQARIFEPFFSTKSVGRGLGLATAEGMVRDHQGAIAVESLPGRGTTFQVLLPSAPQESATAAPAAAPDTWNAQGCALVIDDDASVRLITNRMLERLGMRALLADDGAAGLELFQRHAGSIRCVLLDLTMPGMHGVTAARELRRMDPSLPIVLMSGYSAEDASHLTSDLRGTAFLNKPFHLGELRSVLRGMLERPSVGAAERRSV